MTTLILTDQEADFFTQFMKYHSDFQMLIESGFFAFRNGEWTGRRDGNGILTKWKISLEGGRTKEKQIK